MSTEQTRFARLRAASKRDARDAPDLRLAVAHGVEAFAHAIDLPYSLRLAEVDVPGELAHDEDVEPGDHLRLERRRGGELGMHARRAQVGEEAERLAQPKDRLLGTLGALELVVARSPTAPNSTASASFAIFNVIAGSGSPAAS